MTDDFIKKSLVEPLTRREQEILQLLIENFSNNQIAEKLILAPSSVKWYVKQIYGKLGVNERNQVANRASELGLVSSLVPPAPQKHNLPSSMTPFIGRQKQIEQVGRMVLDSNCRLITLTGAGGVGKTRLALKVAELSLSAFSHGVWLVELASLNDSSLVDQTVASIFGLNGDRDRDTIDLLRDYLHEKKILLILDNCEQLIYACARLAETLLRACPKLHILVTSREALDIEGEIPFSVPSMAFPDPHHLPNLTNLPQYEAVQLFIERTQSFVPTFAVTEANAKDIVQICRRLDGIPLALELAAARVKILGVDQIATHLEESFQLLARGFRTALPRHQTMRASINWSYQLLSETERILLCRFSVFAGGWTLDAVKEICADENIPPYTVIDLLTQLVNKSLVTVENEPGKGIRYYLMDAIWDFAQEKLMEADEVQSVYNSHLNYFHNLAKAAEPKLRGPEQINWLDRLGNELPNLRIALDWGMKTNISMGLRLASAIAAFWQIRGQVSEGLNWLSKGLKSLALDNPSPVGTGLTENTHQFKLNHARALTAAGFLWKMGGEPKKATVLLDESLAIYQEMKNKDQTDLAFTLIQLASCATAMGNFEQANDYANESLAIFKRSQDLYGISECFLTLGNNETDPARAKNLFLDALELKREFGDINGLAYTLQLLCEITVHETDFERATLWLEESLDVYQKVGNKKSIVNCLYNLAWIAWVIGDYPLAIQRISESISLSQEIEEKALLASGLLMKSDVRLSQGNYTECGIDIQTGLRIGQEMGYKAIIASALVKQGHLAFINHQIDQAVKLLQESLIISRTLDNKSINAFCLYHLGQVACEQKNIKTASAYFKQSMQLFYEMNFWYWDYIAYSLEGMAILSQIREGASQVAWYYGAARRLFQSLANTQSPLERKCREDHLALAQTELGEENFQIQFVQGYTQELVNVMLSLE
jgi:predicted ATPase/DNA-binding CsgD family transcriptional regulator